MNPKTLKISFRPLTAKGAYCRVCQADNLGLIRANINMTCHRWEVLKYRVECAIEPNIGVMCWLIQSMKICSLLGNIDSICEGVDYILWRCPWYIIFHIISVDVEISLNCDQATNDEQAASSKFLVIWWAIPKRLAGLTNLTSSPNATFSKLCTFTLYIVISKISTIM